MPPEVLAYLRKAGAKHARAQAAAMTPAERRARATKASKAAAAVRTARALAKKASA
jgi:hypothetical protein